MAIYINGKSIHPFINGKRIATIYRGGKLIYRDYVKVGTTLWNGNTYYTSDTNITLSQPMSKLKSGIVINATNYDQVWWDFGSTGDPNHPTKNHAAPAPTLSAAIHQQIPVKTMANGATYDLLIGASYNGEYIRFTKVNDTTIKVGNSPAAGNIYTGHGTTYYDSSSNYPQSGSVLSLIIASITAY